MPAEVLSSAGFGLENCVAALGADPSGITPEPGPNVEANAGLKTMPLDRFAARLEAAARLTRRPDLGLFFAQSFDMRRFGALGYLMHHAATIRDSLEAYVAYYPKIQSSTEVALEVGNGLASVDYLVCDGSPSNRSQDAEFSTGIILRFVSSACGTRWRHGTLRFTHKPQQGRLIASRDLQPAPFDIRPQFEARSNSLVFPAEYLGLLNPMADAELSDILRAHLDQQDRVGAGKKPFLRALELAIRDELENGSTGGMESVALKMRRSTRNLQRDCAAHGTSFRQARNEAVMSIARDWLRTTEQSVTEISLRLGFSEISSFSRAFRSYHGMSPRQVRSH